jgi:hypothetical protein
MAEIGREAQPVKWKFLMQSISGKEWSARRGGAIEKVLASQ